MTDIDLNSLIGMTVSEAKKTAKRFLYKTMVYPVDTIKISIPIDNTILMYYNDKKEICEANFLGGNDV